MLTRVGSRRTGIAATILAGTMLLTGCSGGDESSAGPPTTDTAGPTTTETPTTEQTTPNEEPVPEPNPLPKPERPAAMDDTGAKGAIAAAEYFFDLYNYVQSTGETELLESISTPRCTACSSLRERVSEIYANGGYMVGGGTILADVNAEPTIDGLAWEVTYDMIVADMQVVHGDGRNDTYTATQYPGARMGAQIIGHDWKILEIYASSS
ncbi:hypothetical protein GCG21_08485 [Pseudactinotalea sp. HY160]|uniref:DUF6318 family protein n=1 Tax=Pseudactinotalea sp. HY160 TaxID=2654490 RepID=UPI00128CDD60|nr:DUF6318 family protein [Pseudactinotalea sp. HY160]MPV50041.1 hypothetical protein [Pseudactinotalea sp. HY160]